MSKVVTKQQKRDVGQVSLEQFLSRDQTRKKAFDYHAYVRSVKRLSKGIDIVLLLVVLLLCALVIAMMVNLPYHLIEHYNRLVLELPILDLGVMSLIGEGQNNLLMGVVDSYVQMGVMLIVKILLYFVPTFCCRSPKKLVILGLNLLFGWVFIYQYPVGWLIMLCVAIVANFRYQWFLRAMMKVD